MKQSTRRPVPVVRVGDVVIALSLLVVFSVGYFSAQSWPFRAALFPELVSIAGMCLAVLTLLGLGARAYRGCRTVAPTGNPTAGGEEKDDVHGEMSADASLEYVFGSAGGRAWVAALAWVATFFLALWLLGVFVTIPLFALAYLRVAGGASWVGATAYAVVSGGVFWFVFHRLLSVPMPTGIF